MEFIAKKTLYSCDLCDFETTNHKNIYILKGQILDGEFNTLHKSDGKMLCESCLLKANTTKETIIELEESDSINNKDLIYFKKVINQKDENELIYLLGYTNPDDFRKVYPKSIIGNYYPVDEKYPNDITNSDRWEKVSVMFSVIAGVPQIKPIDLHISNTIGYKNKDQYNQEIVS